MAYNDWLTYNGQIPGLPSTGYTTSIPGLLGWGLLSSAAPGGTMFDNGSFNMYPNITNISDTTQSFLPTNANNTMNPWSEQFNRYYDNINNILETANGLSWLPKAQFGLGLGSALAGAWGAWNNAREARRQNDRSWLAMKTGYNNQAAMTREALQARQANQRAFGDTSTISDDDIRNIKNIG